MTSFLPEFFLWLFVINLGIACGAGLYERRIVLPLWFIEMPDSGLIVNTEAMQKTNVGLRFWMFVTTGPLTILTLVNLVLAFLSASPRHDWWLGAALIVLLERIGTFAFFIPTAIKLGNADQLNAPTASALAIRWRRLNYLREAGTLAGWLLALYTLSLPG